ncbi:GPR endopeptidase, partial [Treponema sp. R6D11]
LGPLVVENIEVTRHIRGVTREISAIIPNVLGKTGIETAEMIKAVAAEIAPDFVIAIDSLASLSLERVNRTIQLSNTGISPGAGIGNFRKTLTEENVGCPIVAVGVPTVASLATVTNSALDIV